MAQQELADLCRGPDIGSWNRELANRSPKCVYANMAAPAIRRADRQAWGGGCQEGLHHPICNIAVESRRIALRAGGSELTTDRINTDHVLMLEVVRA
eukprot:3169288-Heterocapsa_arctica.AAC.1